MKTIKTIATLIVYAVVMALAVWHYKFFGAFIFAVTLPPILNRIKTKRYGERH